MTAHTPTHTSEGSAYAKKCKTFIDKEGIKAEQLHFSECVHTATDAIRLTAAKGSALVVVKTVVLAARYAVGSEGVEEEHYLACILRGDKKVDIGKMREVLGTGRIRTATREEVLNQTGYPAGGVPPFGHDLATYIDDEAMELTDVIAGGGSDRALVKTTMNEIARVTDAHVARIARRETVAHAPAHKPASPRHVVHTHNKTTGCTVCVKSKGRNGSIVCVRTR